MGVQRPQFDVSSDRAVRQQGFHRTVMGTKSGKGAWSVGYRSTEQAPVLTELTFWAGGREQTTEKCTSCNVR